MMSYEKTTLGVSATQGHFRDIMLPHHIRKGSLLLYLRCSVWSIMFTYHVFIQIAPNKYC